MSNDELTMSMKIETTIKKWIFHDIIYFGSHFLNFR
jgi:hypothetical protein